MLCDTIVQEGYLEQVYNGFTVIQEKLKKAQKFSLAPDFAAAADGLVDNYKELHRITPYCRLPFPITWIEFSHLDRPHFASAELIHPQFQGIPSRIGFLLQASDTTMSRYNASLMWTMRNPPPGQLKVNASLIAVDFDINNLEEGDDLKGLIKLHIPDYSNEAFKIAYENGILTSFTEIMRSDWAGEIRFLVAVLGLLNARNVVESERVDKTEHNRKRAKAKQEPLSSHTILKIRSSHKPLKGKEAGSETGSEIRAHFVRGHFKTRRTGLFFWGPHMRGRLSKGFISKDYEVT